MKSRLICLLTIITLLFNPFSIIPCHGINESVKVIFNREEMKFTDAVPFINKDNRVMVPVRALSEKLGAEVEWDGDKKNVTITSKNGNRIYVKLNEYMYWINDLFPFGMDTKAIIVNNRVFVPLRFVSEALGAEITWDGESKTVNVQFSGDNDKLIEKKIINPKDAEITKVPVDSLEIRTERTLESARLTGISCTRDAFVVVGEKGIIKFSYDGYNWRSGNSPTSDNLYSVANNGTVFVAVGENNSILYSSDLINWNKAELNPHVSCNFYGVIYDGNRFVAVGNRKAAWSYDGVNWQEYNCELEEVYSYGGCFLAYNGDAYVVFIPNQVRGACFISHNLKDWTPVENIPVLYNGIESLYCDGENFILKVYYYYTSGETTASGMELPATGYVYLQSSDGINWVTASAEKKNLPFIEGVPRYYSPFKIAYNGDIYVNAGGDIYSFGSDIKVSRDNKNWEYVMGGNDEGVYYLNGSLDEEDRFVVRAGSFISTDGCTWKRGQIEREIFQMEDLQGNVTQYPRNYRLTLSKDIFSNMEYRFDTVSFYIAGILKVEDYYLAYGHVETYGEYANPYQTSVILKFDKNCNYSVVFNALDWGIAKTTNSSVQSLACTGEKFVASFYHENNKKYTATSYDLCNWIIKEDDENTDSITSAEGKFIKISGNSISVSEDGINFNKVYGSKDSFYRLYWDGNKILACANPFDNYNSSRIYYSYDGINWKIYIDDISGHVSSIIWNDDMYILCLNNRRLEIIIVPQVTKGSIPCLYNLIGY